MKSGSNAAKVTYDYWSYTWNGNQHNWDVYSFVVPQSLYTGSQSHTTGLIIQTNTLSLPPLSMHYETNKELALVIFMHLYSFNSEFK